VDYVVLRNELLNDPVPLGYKLNPGGKDNTYVSGAMTDQAAADKLNATNTNRTLTRDVIATWEMKEAIVQSEYAAASTANRQWLDMILSGESVNNKPGNIRTGLLAIFGTTSATRANLIPLQTRVVSRAEEIGLEPVTTGDVGKARANYW
jgi:hypothetical protein